jgi:hypothetical protein
VIIPVAVREPDQKDVASLDATAETRLRADLTDPHFGTGNALQKNPHMS